MRQSALALAFALSLAACDEEPAEEPTPEDPVAEEPVAEEAEPEEPAALQYDGPPLACARAVVVAWQGAVAAAESVTRSKEEAQARATELLAQVEGGQDFAEIARANSDASSSGPRGGLLGTYTEESWPRAHEVLKAPVFGLEVGERTEVIEAPYGYAFAERCELELVHPRHILVRYAGARNADGVERTEAEARAMAEAIHAEIEGGADFEATAREKSEDGSAERGGDVGIVGRGVLAPEFEETVYAMSPGTVSDVVKTDFGFHIIQRVE